MQTLVENIIDCIETSSNDEYCKVRIVVGFKVSGMDCFLYRKFGGIFKIGQQQQNAVYLATKAWKKITSNDDWQIFDMPLFGYHFGMDYSVNDQGQILGDWPTVAMLKINCDEIFLVKPVMILPEEYSHLKLFPLPRPTGKIIA